MMSASDIITSWSLQSAAAAAAGCWDSLSYCDDDDDDDCDCDGNGGGGGGGVTYVNLMVGEYSLKTGPSSRNVV